MDVTIQSASIPAQSLNICVFIYFSHSFYGSSIVTGVILTQNILYSKISHIHD